jgi:chorismate mutase
MKLEERRKKLNDGIINNPRAEIDAIDSELLWLLNSRAEIVLRVGAMKTIFDMPLGDSEREREILTRLVGENRGPLSKEAIVNIFQRIIDESRNLQQETYLKASELD